MNRLSILLLCLVSSWVSAKDSVLTYGPSHFELTGSLELQTFPGPPSYESVKDGDEAERGFYLRLDSPVDVVPKGAHSGVENAQTERKVRVMQLAIDEEDDGLWKRLRKIGKGRRVKIEGTLFHQCTGQHHSRVLLSVNKMELLGR